jgi:hypothetical protein
MNHNGVKYSTDDYVTTVQSASDDSWQPLDEDIHLVHLPAENVDYGQQDMTDGNDLSLHIGEYIRWLLYNILKVRQYNTGPFFKAKWILYLSN